MLRCALLGCSLVGIGCHHEPPPRPPAAQRAVAGPGDLAGSWVSSDDLDWGYEMKIDAKGWMAQTIERGRMGTCVQDGQLAAGAGAGAGAGKSFAFAYKHDTCDQGGPGAARTLEVESFTADELVVIVRGGVSPLRRRYTPDPKVEAPPK